MELIRNACIIDLVANAIFTNRDYKSYTFDWSVIANHNNRFDSSYNYDDARILLQLSLMVTKANFTETPLMAPNWLMDYPLHYMKCPMKSLNVESSKNINLGHVLYNEQQNILFIIFTGTSDMCMGGIDIDYTQIEIDGILNYIPGMKGHRGIYLAYQSIRNQLIEIIRKYSDRKPKIIITGHSLGGGVSGLCTLDLAYYEPLHYSFASPLFFNPMGCEVFGHLVKKSYRIANLSDLVALCPLPIMPNKDCFCHIGNPVLFQRNMCDYPNNHSLAYVMEYNVPYIESS